MALLFDLRVGLIRSVPNADTFTCKEKEPVARVATVGLGIPGPPAPLARRRGWRRGRWSGYDHRMTDPTTKILLTFAMLTGAVSAQSRTFYDASGNVVGSAADSSSTVTNDARGKVITRETTSGNTATIYDARGRLIGQRR